MASIIKRCDCGDWDDCPRPWVVRYRTQGGRTSKRHEQSFGDDLREAEDFLLKVEHDKKAHVFIDPKAGRVTFRAEAEAWLACHLGADSTVTGYRPQWNPAAHRRGVAAAASWHAAHVPGRDRAGPPLGASRHAPGSSS